MSTTRSFALQYQPNNMIPRTGALIGRAVAQVYLRLAAALAVPAKKEVQTPEASLRQIRTMADGLVETQPSYAADLYAAADRYEQSVNR